MALQPVVRPAGSSHVLRYQGNIIGSPTPTVASGEVPAVVGATTLYQVFFYLADLTDLTDTQRRLPASVYDDTEPAAASPHAALDGGPSGNTGFLPPSGKTWMQNVRVRAEETFAFLASTAPLAEFRTLTPICGLDANGIPYVSIGVTFTAAGIALINGAGAGVPVVVEVEIPLAATR